MAEPALKLAPQPAGLAPPAPKEAPPGKEAAPRQTLRGALRARLRLILLVIVPLIAALAGLALYLTGGRYISTDNAYVGAQKVLITPDISGRVSRVLVHEGQHVAAGDALFEIDPVPFRLAVTQAQSKLEGVRTDFANLKSNYESLTRLIELSKKNIELKQHDVDRKSALLATRTTSAADVDTATATLVTAQLQGQLAVQQRSGVLNQLQGNPDLAIADFPPFRLAQAALDQAQRDLDHTLVKAPIDGTATQVDNIQLGRFAPAGTPVFSIIDDRAPWVDANPKETDVTWLRVGQKVDVAVDSFPDRPFHGTVASVSPGTGAQFAILPPQNASGNWVKVVQRVPVRITFDPGQDLSLLRAGMSVTVDIDTGRQHSLATLLGATPSVASEARP
jgi:membrane fusion protein (multidrug efflux system)